MQYVKCGFAGENFPTSVFPCVVGRPMLRYEESLTEQALKVYPKPNNSLLNHIIRSGCYYCDYYYYCDFDYDMNLDWFFVLCCVVFRILLLVKGVQTCGISLIYLIL